MTIYAVCAEPGDFGAYERTPVDATTLSVYTASDNYWHADVRCAISVDNGTLLPMLDFGQDVSEVWVRWCVLANIGRHTAGKNPAIFRDSGGVERILLEVSQSATENPVNLRFVKVDSLGNKTQLGGTFTAHPSKVNLWHIHVVYGTSGSVSFYYGRERKFHYEGDVTTDGATTLRNVAFEDLSTTNGWNVWVSAVVAASTPTFGIRLDVNTPTADGEVQDWTGSYTDVNDLDFNGSTTLSSATAGQVATFQHAGVTLTGAEEIVAVQTSAYAAKGISGPGNIEVGFRKSSADATLGLSSPVALTTNFSGMSHMAETNPFTGSAWTEADVDALRIALRSAT